MSLPQEKKYSYADLLAWEDDPTHYELYDGQLRALSSPTDVHQLILTELLTQIHTHLRGTCRKIYPAPLDVRLFENNGDNPKNVKTVVQPDLSVACKKNGKVDTRGIHGAPDLIIEILSPSTKQYDCLIKYKLYQQAGVKEYWIVDPDKQLVLVYMLEDGQYYVPEVYTAKDIVPVGVLEDCSVDLTKVFPEE
ncbi:Uma2 family endonuclease [Colidextribacter sp. OB.20]|uniref:Uma2 family endonuclease n=1 Tax=Colidextribacter sp. OB.20 TaxID=2304568 RepID=UPI001370FA33|nr:Uma2 family endonuclease [Colidextribacter sp. OB.20]NBI09003.1 Uma2 family endonuclease [Colidextribacter sp. OB.20]